MKNVLKKFTAAVMAFTLLGTGTAFSKSNKNLEANAANPKTCPACHGTQTGSWASNFHSGNATLYYIYCGHCCRITGGFWA